MSFFSKILGLEPATSSTQVGSKLPESKSSLASAPTIQPVLAKVPNQLNVSPEPAVRVDSMTKPQTVLTKDLSTYRDALNYGTLIKGKVSFEGSVRIDGKLDGEIVCTDNLLIGERAEINASLSANNLIIQGIVKGAVKAKGKVEILASAKVEGEICSPDLVIEPGARVNSTCKISQ